MKAVIDGLFDRLQGDATFWTGLAPYRASRALFTADKVPVDADRPYATIAGPIGASPFDTKDRRGHELEFDISVFMDAEGDPSVVEALALRAQQLLHAQAGAIAITGWTVLIAEALAPVRYETNANARGGMGTTDDTIDGRRVAVRLVIRPA